MKRPVLLVAAVVFLQLLCVGANFSTLQPYNDQLGGTVPMLGLLWLALSAPRALMSPLWGSLSDRVGRRPLMILGGVATLCGSVLWALSGNWYVLLASRLVDSAFAAQSTLAPAIIADTTTPERRSSGMALMGAAAGLALTLGPVLGYAGAEWFSLSGVGWVMAALQATSLLLVLIFLKETRPAHPQPQTGLAIFRAESWRRAFASPSAAAILMVAFAMTVAVGHFNAAFPLASEEWFGWGTREDALGFALLGFVGVLVQGGLVRPLVPRVGEKRLIVAGIPLIALGFAVMGLRPPGWGMYAGIVLAATGGGLAVPCLQGLLSRMVPAGDQGMVLGLARTAETMGRSIGPAIAAPLFALQPAAAFWSAAAFAVVAVLLMGRVRGD